MARTFWQKQLTEFGTVATLTVWRWRQQWLLLFITGLGVLTATTLICSLPLFSSVTLTTGLRTTLRASPDNMKIEVHMGLAGLSSATLDEATRQVSARFTRDLASYVNTSGDLSTQIEVPNWLITGTINQVVLHGASMQAAAPHLQVLEGRLPDDHSSELEVALTRSAATYMQVHVGSTIRLLGVAKTIPTTDAQPEIYPQTLLLRVVGLFQTIPGDTYWHSQTFQEPAPLPHDTPVPFHVLISSLPFFHWIDTLAQQYQTKGVSFTPSSTCFLTYRLAAEHLSSSQLDDLITRLQQLQADVAHMQNANADNPYAGEPVFPYIAGVSISGAALRAPPGPDLLDTFQNEILLERATMLILTIQIAGLVLFFVSMLAQAQVERQTPALALLRSRGASSLQVLATLFIQGFMLCLLAGCLAPLLALAVVRLSAPFFLPSTAQDALNVLPSTFTSLLSMSGSYALAALLIVLGTLLLAFITALRGNILTLRREAARSTRRPLWLHLRLDLVLAVLALASYGFAFYTQGTAQLLDAQSQLLLLAPLSLLAPLLLLLACVLFFLRLFPLLLRLCLRLVANRRDAASLLAVAQIARAPRQPVRLTLLLGLALAFTIFTLVFAASQAQRAQDLASYQAGADFSGYLPATFQAPASVSQAQVIARYRALAGVISASAGYAGQADLQVNPGTPNEFFRPLQVRAVDPQTFEQTAVWTPQTSSQSLHSLLTQLVTLRSQALQRNVVPAILSASAWGILNVHPGTVFHIFTTDGTPDPVSYLAVTSSAHLPPANESVESGMLVDFQTLQTAYQHQKAVLPANYIWLQTNENPSTLLEVRRALSTAPLLLSSLADRQMLVQINAANPLVLNLLATLSMGVSAALLLALLANLLLPALDMRARLTSFAFLRALGAAPSQVLRLLIWEQGLVLVAALLLGTLLGFPLALIAVPALVVNSIPVGSTQAGGANAVYLLQELIPARIVLPPALLLALAVLLALCALALLLVSRMALRLTLSQQMRLNED